MQPSSANSEVEPVPRRPFVLSYGMGVESHAILERWLAEPGSRPFESLADLIVVTSQVGEEHRADTVANVERRTLPLLRQHGIRFVELARRGFHEKDGIVILQDTRSPVALHPDGAFKLSDELLQCGTIPQFGSTGHRCAMKFKGFVIEAFLAHEFRGAAQVPVFDAERDSDDLRAGVPPVSNPVAPVVAFGFNADEVNRIDRNRLYDGSTRTGLYPLQDWGWGRDKCQSYILDQSGIRWTKSACSFCPFNCDASKGSKEAVERWNADPEQTARGLLVEFNALSFNPRGQLFKNKSLLEVVQRAGAHAALEAFERQLDATPWALYRVRRIYTSKAVALRCVERLATGSRGEMTRRFEATAAGSRSLRVKALRGIAYAFMQERTENVYPSAEGFYVIAPAFVGTKVRGTITAFDGRWSRVLAGRPLAGTTEDPRQVALNLDAAA